MSITETNEYRALADKARLGVLSEEEKSQWKNLQAQAQAEQQSAAAAAQQSKNAAYWHKVARLPTPAAPQATLLSTPPAADAAPKTTPEEEATRKRLRLLAARGTLFTTNNRNPLGGDVSPVGGAPASLGGARTLLS